MRPFRVYPYKLGSCSGSALAEALGVYLIKPDGEYKYKKGHIIINWGNGTKPLWGMDLPSQAVLNHWAYVGKSRISQLVALSNHVNIPFFTVDKELVRSWLQMGKIVVARTVLNGHSGQGIVILKPGDVEVVDAPLYTIYQKKSKEFRVHVAGGEVIDIQEKRKVIGKPPSSMLIRTHANGWIFARENLELPEGIESMAIQAVQCLHLYFGAVDIVWSKAQSQLMVLEVNTAPGLEGKTLQSYVEHFQGLI